VPGGNVLTELGSACSPEKEPLTRGLLLLSVGSHGGAAARDLGGSGSSLRGRQADDRGSRSSRNARAERRPDALAPAPRCRDGLRDEASAQSAASGAACGLAHDAEAGLRCAPR